MNKIWWGGKFYNFAALTNTIRNMKKFLLFIVAVVASGVAHAQGFSKSIEIGGMLGLGTYNNKSADVSFIGGYAFSPRFFIGAGVGFRYTDALYYQSYTHTSVQYVSDTYESRSQEYLIPVYARIKYNFSDKFVAPFIQGNVGYSFNVGGNTKAVKGLYLEPAIGIDFNLKNKQAIYFTVGYAMQHSEYVDFIITETDQSQDYYKDLAGAISIKIGFKF